MSAHRTTVSLNPEIYSQVRAHYKEMGFTRVSDLINAAVAEYIAREEIRRKDRLMELAAEDPRYLLALREVSRDFESVDREGWPDY